MIQKEININSTIEDFSFVDLFLNSIYTEFKLSREDFFRIYLSMREAVNNAIIHGNCKNISKRIHINFSSCLDHLYFQVSDEGVGFDFCAVPDPTLPENIKKESGRGIFFMKKYADQVIFEDDGRTVKLIFEIHGN